MNLVSMLPARKSGSAMMRRCSGMRGVDSLDDEHLQRARHARDGLIAVLAAHDQLGDQRIVVGRHHAFGVRRGVDAHAGSARRIEGRDLARRRRELFRMLGVDAALDGVAADARSGRAGRRSSFSPAAIRIWLFTRSTSVTISVTGCSTWMRVFISMKYRLPSSSIRNSTVPAFTYPISAQRLRPACLPIRSRSSGVTITRGRFLEQFLVAALDGALALAEADHVAVLVGQHLELDVARLLDELFHVEIAVAERRRRLRLRRVKQVGQFFVAADDAHAAPAAAGRGLHDHREADLLRPLERFVRRGDHAFGAGQDRHAGLLHGLRAFSFSPIRRMTSGGGPMNLMPQVSHTSAKLAFSLSRP